MRKKYSAPQIMRIEYFEDVLTSSIEDYQDDFFTTTTNPFEQ